MDKTILITRLLNARDDWEQLINHVSSKRAGGISGAWLVRNSIAHVMVHEQYAADRLGELSHGEVFIPCQTQETLEAFIEEYGYPDFESPLMSVEAADEWVSQKYRNVEMRELIASELQAFDGILSQVRVLSESQLNEPGMIGRIASATLDRYRRHGAEIRGRFKHLVLRSGE